MHWKKRKKNFIFYRNLRWTAGACEPVDAPWSPVCTQNPARLQTVSQGYCVHAWVPGDAPGQAPQRAQCWSVFGAYWSWNSEYNCWKWKQLSPAAVEDHLKQCIYVFWRKKFEFWYVMKEHLRKLNCDCDKKNQIFLQTVKSNVNDLLYLYFFTKSYSNSGFLNELLDF